MKMKSLDDKDSKFCLIEKLDIIEQQEECVPTTPLHYFTVGLRAPNVCILFALLDQGSSKITARIISCLRLLQFSSHFCKGSSKPDHLKLGKERR